MTHVTRRKQTKEINYNVIEEIIKFVDLWIDPVKWQKIYDLS